MRRLQTDTTTVEQMKNADVSRVSANGQETNVNAGDKPKASAPTGAVVVLADVDDPVRTQTFVELHGADMAREARGREVQRARHVARDERTVVSGCGHVGREHPAGHATAREVPGKRACMRA
jgi:hypothetical protein